MHHCAGLRPPPPFINVIKANPKTRSKKTLVNSSNLQLAYRPGHGYRDVDPGKGPTLNPGRPPAVGLEPRADKSDPAKLQTQHETQNTIGGTATVDGPHVHACLRVSRPSVSVNQPAIQGFDAVY